MDTPEKDYPGKFPVIKERVICAAIWVKDGAKYDHQPKNVESGLVICGRRHHNCFSTLKALIGLDKIISERVQGIQTDQGFLTSSDRFVDRKEAWVIAKDNNQIIYEPVDNEIQPLFSEDIY